MQIINTRIIKSVVAAAVAVAVSVGLAACGGSSATSKEDDKTITVAASPTPHAEILNKAVKPILEKDGYKLEVKEFTDYVQPNTATEDGDVDANYFQHKPYLDNFNKEKGTHLVSVETVHFEPFGLYPGKTKSLDDLKDGATVAVPNDATNEARALLLLQDAGLIELKNPEDINSTPKDIVSNPKNLQFKELEAAVVPTVLSDVDIAALNGNYAIQAKFDPTKDALATEKADGIAAKTYANILVVKEGNENTDKTKELKKALNSSEVRDYINDTYKGAVVPVF
ncbi:MetQ/NlpA family ABC transporter substrate-binding protein [Bifidobacterium jacchi]|uniref:MetQ/NlpA family ABC transporter substrate-binding protein n=1 Tax=Bifidobacterium jacchi TaxID=2490545 RepID=UPI0015882538|nr:MetQ/NlpA family ABC transporter substrate-binding protein [Bifidobacterium jacchi]